MEYQLIVGLEIHCELKTQSKMFCSCSADHFRAPANTHTCPTCLGMPGTLPVPNKQAIEYVYLLAQALGFEPAEESKFERKHYFYPDLPKGYQISQYGKPIGQHGKLDIMTLEGTKKTIRIQRVHLEEDAGKLAHEDKNSRVDLNRAGVPLMEIVTEPEFHNVEDVRVFLEELQTVIRYLGISDADMERGSMRLEPNISLKPLDPNQQFKKPFILKHGLPPYKVEVKNINSFRYVVQAIEYEIKRHKELLDNGEIPTQETRGFDEKSKTTFAQRSKENAVGYKYFPEPDIPPFGYTKDEVKTLATNLPLLPLQFLEQLIEKYGIKYQDAFILTRNLRLAEYFERVLSQLFNSNSISKSEVAQKVANLIINKKISTDLSIEDFIHSFNELSKPVEVDLDLVNQVVTDVLQKNEKVVLEYRNGNVNVLMFLVGQCKKQLGQTPVDVAQLITMLKERLEN